MQLTKQKHDPKKLMEAFIKRIPVKGKMLSTEIIRNSGYIDYNSLLKNNQLDWNKIKNNFCCYTLTINNECNSNCNICYYEGKEVEKGGMSVEDIKMFSQKVGNGKTISLFAKEPTLKKSLFEMIKIIKKTGNFPEVYTNGLKLAEEDFVKKLKASGVEKVCLSFDGFKPETYEELRNGPMDLEMKLKALENLKRQNIQTLLPVVVKKGTNEHEISQIIRFAAAEGNEFISGVRFISFVPYGKLDVEKIDFIYPTDILEKIKEGFKIEPDYFLEFKKFLFNINTISEKIKIPYGTASPYGIFKTKNGNIDTLVSKERLRKFNNCYESGKYIKAAAHGLCISKSLMGNIKPAKKPSGWKHNLKNKLISISTGAICNPYTYKGINSDTLSFAGSDDPKKPFKLTVNGGDEPV